jgi:hypothetical protein
MTNSRALTRAWTPEEENKLLALLDLGKTAAEIAIELNRTTHAVYGRLQRFYRKPAAPKPYPSARQRHVLQMLLRGEWMPLSKLSAVGETMLGHLLDEGWIERGAAEKDGPMYRITGVGQTAFRTPIPFP